MYTCIHVYYTRSGLAKYTGIHLKHAHIVYVQALLLSHQILGTNGIMLMLNLVKTEAESVLLR